jgi:hypothetical protein
VANLGNKNLILQELMHNFNSFGVETGNIDLRQSNVDFTCKRKRLRHKK